MCTRISYAVDSKRLCLCQALNRKLVRQAHRFQGPMRAEHFHQQAPAYLSCTSGLAIWISFAFSGTRIFWMLTSGERTILDLSLSRKTLHKNALERK